MLCLTLYYTLLFLFHELSTLLPNAAFKQMAIVIILIISVWERGERIVNLCPAGSIYTF